MSELPRIAILPVPETHPFWEEPYNIRICEGRTYGTHMENKADAVSSDNITRHLISIDLEFDPDLCQLHATQITQKGSSDVESVPFDISMHTDTWASACKREDMPTMRQLFLRAEEVMQWLETDPLIDGKTIGAHYLETKAKQLLQKLKDANDATKARAGDPGFGKKEAVRVLDELKERARKSTRTQRVEVVLRDGTTGSGKVVDIRATCDRGSDRVRLKWNGEWGRGTAYKEVVRKLQDMVSAQKTKQRWGQEHAKNSS